MAKRTRTDEARQADRVSRRGPRKGDLKEAAILDTTWQLLSEKVPSAITIDEIAQGAGISRPTFYFYFDSREAAIHALALRRLDELRATTVDVVDPNETPRENIRRGVMALLERWRTDGPVLRAMDALVERDEALRTFWDQVAEPVLAVAAAQIEAERAAGRAPDGPPAEDLARAHHAMIWRSGYEASLGRWTRRQQEHLADTLTDIIVRSIYGSVAD